jgi:hypothetical protein
VPAHAHHLDQQQADEHRRGQRGNALVERLIRHLQPQPRADQRRDDRDAQPDAHAAHQRRAVGLLQIPDDDPDDQKGFETLPKSDEQSLQHAWRGTIARRSLARSGNLGAPVSDHPEKEMRCDGPR